jgi:hypothetical protein
MMHSLMGEGELEESVSTATNLELLTIYTYPDRFILKMSESIGRVRTNLLIDRKTVTIRELST